MLSRRDGRVGGFFLGLLLIDVLVFGFVAGAIWQNKGGSFGAGFAWGALLGILGLIYVAAAKPVPRMSQNQPGLPVGPASSLAPAPVVAGPVNASVPQHATTPSPSALPAAPRQMRECPHCKEPMRRDASVCPHCRRDSDAWTYDGGVWRSRSADGSEVWLDERSMAWRPLDDLAAVSDPPASLASIVNTGGRFSHGTFRWGSESFWGVWQKDGPLVERFPDSDDGYTNAYSLFQKLERDGR
jgi:hypothetical protein